MSMHLVDGLLRLQILKRIVKLNEFFTQEIMFQTFKAQANEYNSGS